MWRLLNRLVRRRNGSEGRAALADAHQSLEAVESRSAEIQKLAGRLHEHGRRNHFGDRIEAAMRGT